MQINIKLKFDKTNKSTYSQNNQNHFFLENTKIKHHKHVHSELKDFHSFAPNCQHTLPDQKQSNTQREQSKDFVRSRSKNCTVKKKSRSKSKNSSNVSSNKNPKPVKKNISDLIKAPKKKLNIINSSNCIQQETFRGSLPGLSGKKVLQRYAPLLSENKKIELINQKTVYYIGIGAGPGEDDLEGTYLWKKHEQIGYRYQLLETLGSGAFGEVVKAYDHKNKQLVAVKIIRSKKQHMQLALNQINILMKAKEKDMQNEKNVVRIKDFIVFRKHICIVTQLLSISLYQLMQSNEFRPIQTIYLRTFAIQVLNCLSFLKQQNIVHSDIKPENILLKNRTKTGIKIIDFGTSMFIHQTSYLYIQSRFYRAPQVILGASYDYAIDMWSFGCLLAELHLGFPIFAGTNQQQQLSLIMQAIGVPPRQYLKMCKNTFNFFSKDFIPKVIKAKDGKVILPQSKPLNLIISDKTLLNFLSKIFIYNPKERITPLMALAHPWIIDGLPEQIKQQHLSYIQKKMKKQTDNDQRLNETIPNQSKQKHSKRNSDFIGKQKITVKHTRRRSDVIQ